MPDPRPVLVDDQYSYLIDGGNETYYFYKDMSDIVSQIQESDLVTILTKLKYGLMSSVETKYLGMSEYDPFDHRKKSYNA